MEGRTMKIGILGAGNIGQTLKAMLASVKAKLAYLTWTLTLLGAMALTVGAGIKWDWY